MAATTTVTLKRDISDLADGTFYHDEVGQSDQVKRLKSSMTLDFNGNMSKKQKVATLLQSPDLNLLKLGSPELERMIIQANGMVTTTPTPTQFVFPKFVTEEQEAYARGFVDALAELHTKPGEGPDGQQQSVMVELPNNTTLTTLSSVPVSRMPISISDGNFTYTPSPLTTTTSLPGGIATSTAKIQRTELDNVRVKEEPQIVPTMIQSDSSPPMSPINMEKQEVIKLERKRARNRVAARKCRTRKLERIAKLEDRVSDLKGQNSDLSTTAQSLRDQVCKLKQQIIEHMNSGCQIMMAQNIQFNS